MADDTASGPPPEAAPPRAAVPKPIGGTTPGLVIGHHRLFASITRSLPPLRLPPRNFVDLMKKVWWPIDGALDEEMLHWAVRLSALEALESGCTAILDHHSSSKVIDGSLDIVTQGCHEVGVRVNCSYAVSDLRGEEVARAGLAETKRFLSAGGEGMVGLDASYLASPDTVDAAIDLAADLRVGVHVKVAEGINDAGGGSDLARRSEHSWVLAHAVHLPDSIDIAGTVVHCPRSNMLTGVGYGVPARLDANMALGTDGLSGSLVDEFRFGFFRLREHNISARASTVWNWLEGGWNLVPGAKGDKVTWNVEGVEPHELWPATGLAVTEVQIAGHTVVSDGKALRVDGEEIRAKAAEQSRRLAKRLSS